MTAQPSTLLEAIAEIIAQWSGTDLDYVRKNGMRGEHHSIGRVIRNEWNLWGANPNLPTTLHEHFKTQYGLGHADDMSGMIIDGIEAVIQRGEYTEAEAQEKARYYHRYWLKQGVDPLTQEEISK